MLGLRPPGFEFRVLCLEGNVITLILPSSGGSPGPIYPVCAEKWPKARFISFIQYSNTYIYMYYNQPAMITSHDAKNNLRPCAFERIDPSGLNRKKHGNWSENI